MVKTKFKKAVSLMLAVVMSLKGTVSDRQRKPSVKAKLDRYKAQSKQQKEAERKEPEVSKPEVKNAPAQTVHQQPKPKSKNVKER